MEEPISTTPERVPQLSTVEEAWPLEPEPSTEEVPCPEPAQAGTSFEEDVEEVDVIEPLHYPEPLSLSIGSP